MSWYRERNRESWLEESWMPDAEKGMQEEKTKSDVRTTTDLVNGQTKRTSEKKK